MKTDDKSFKEVFNKIHDSNNDEIFFGVHQKTVSEDFITLAEMRKNQPAPRWMSSLEDTKNFIQTQPDRRYNLIHATTGHINLDKRAREAAVCYALEDAKKNTDLTPAQVAISAYFYYGYFTHLEDPKKHEIWFQELTPEEKYFYLVKHSRLQENDRKQYQVKALAALVETSITYGGAIGAGMAASSLGAGPGLAIAAELAADGPSQRLGEKTSDWIKEKYGPNPEWIFDQKIIMSIPASTLQLLGNTGIFPFVIKDQEIYEHVQLSMLTGRKNSDHFPSYDPASNTALAEAYHKASDKHYFVQNLNEDQQEQLLSLLCQKEPRQVFTYASILRGSLDPNPYGGGVYTETGEVSRLFKDGQNFISDGFILALKPKLVAKYAHTILPLASENGRKCLFDKLKILPTCGGEKPTASQINEPSRLDDEVVTKPPATSPPQPEQVTPHEPEQVTPDEVREIAHGVVSITNPDPLGLPSEETKATEEKIVEEFKESDPHRQQELQKIYKDIADKMKRFRVAECFEQDMQTLASSLNTLGRAAQAARCETLMRTAMVGASMAIMVGSAVKISGIFAAASSKLTLSLLTPVGAFVGAALSLCSLFFGRSDKQLQRALESISEQLTLLHQDMQKGFARLFQETQQISHQILTLAHNHERESNAFFSLMQNSFALLKVNQEDEAQKTLSSQRSALETALGRGENKTFLTKLSGLFNPYMIDHRYNGITGLRGGISPLAKMDVAYLGYYKALFTNSEEQPLPHWDLWSYAVALYEIFYQICRQKEYPEEMVEDLLAQNRVVVQVMQRHAENLRTFFKEQLNAHKNRQEIFQKWVDQVGAECHSAVTNTRSCSSEMEKSLINNLCPYGMISPFLPTRAEMGEVSAEEWFWKCLKRSGLEFTSLGTWGNQKRNMPLSGAPTYFPSEDVYKSENPFSLTTPHGAICVKKWGSRDRQGCHALAATKSLWDHLLPSRPEGPPSSSVPMAWSHHIRSVCGLPSPDAPIRAPETHTHISINACIQHPEAFFRGWSGIESTSSPHRLSSSLGDPIKIYTQETIRTFLNLFESQKNILKSLGILTSTSTLTPLGQAFPPMELALRVQIRIDMNLSLHHYAELKNIPSHGGDWGTGFSITFESPVDFHERFVKYLRDCLSLMCPESWSSWNKSLERLKFPWPDLDLKVATAPLSYEERVFQSVSSKMMIEEHIKNILHKSQNSSEWTQETFVLKLQTLGEAKDALEAVSATLSEAVLFADEHIPEPQCTDFKNKLGHSNGEIRKISAKIRNEQRAKGPSASLSADALSEIQGALQKFGCQIKKNV